MKKASSSSNSIIESLTQLVSKLKKDYRSFPFHFPVDYRKLMLYNYPLIIKTPMDLKTLQENINEGVYSSLEEFKKDLMLIWENCRVYNKEGSNIYELADQLDVFSRDLLKEIEDNKDICKSKRKNKDKGSKKVPDRKNKMIEVIEKCDRGEKNEKIEENNEKNDKIECNNEKIEENNEKNYKIEGSNRRNNKLEGNNEKNYKIEENNEKSYKIEENNNEIEVKNEKKEENNNKIEVKIFETNEISPRIEEISPTTEKKLLNGHNQIEITTNFPIKSRNLLKRQAKTLETLSEDKIFFHKKMKLNNMTKQMTFSQIKKLIKIIRTDNTKACEFFSEKKLIIKLDSLYPEIVQKLLETFENDLPYSINQ